MKYVNYYFLFVDGLRNVKSTWPNILTADVGHVVFAVAMRRKGHLRFVSGQVNHIITGKNPKVIEAVKHSRNISIGLKYLHEFPVGRSVVQNPLRKFTANLGIPLRVESMFLK